MVSTPAVSLWAVLGQGHMGQRSGILLLVSTAIGLLAHAFAGVGPSPVWFWPLVLDLQAAIMILSLLVVRSCGYRLVRRTPGLATSAPIASTTSSSSPPAANTHDLAP
jgi:hypothetical protein